MYIEQVAQMLSPDEVEEREREGERWHASVHIARNSKCHRQMFLLTS
jgi:hypothetical protein